MFPITEKAILPGHTRHTILISLIFRLVSNTFPHSPILYGYWVETYGPYPQDYMR